MKGSFDPKGASTHRLRTTGLAACINRVSARLFTAFISQISQCEFLHPTTAVQPCHPNTLKHTGSRVSLQADTLTCKRHRFGIMTVWWLV